VPYHAELPGKYDQRHTFYVDAAYRLGRRWKVNLAWQFHTGWPYTPREITVDTAGSYVVYDIAIGEPMSRRYPDYHRLDLRINHYWQTSSGRITFFLEIMNLYDRNNLRTFEYEFDCPQSAGCTITLEKKYWVSLMPSIGLIWSLDI
jgi:hypothetical protein